MKPDDFVRPGPLPMHGFDVVRVVRGARPSACAAPTSSAKKNGPNRCYQHRPALTANLSNQEHG